jgi:phenylacetate-coenzyme A ligase PaaK-like adenylate-forming protein
MTDFNSNKIFDITSENDFIKCALELFNYQYTNCNIYQKYCLTRNINPFEVLTLESIPFLPIQFFKRFPIIDNTTISNILFTSSGTTSSNTSSHYVSDIEIYRKSFLKGFTTFYGNPEEYSILALLPSYLERKGSSLVFMFNELIEMTKQNGSAFYLHNHDELFEKLKINEQRNQKTILIGVSFALLDFAEKYSLQLQNTILMETGGMKGHGKELPREDLHTILQNRFSLRHIHSEFGMTELLSQAYSKGNGLFSTPPWMKILVRDLYDPYTFLPLNTKGGLNIIDLANIHSCSFIETQDLGILKNDSKFEINGRIDNSDIRGCNLII